MKKKILSLVIVGVMAVVSVPAVSASASVNTQSVEIQSSRYATVKPGTKAYESKGPAGAVGYFAAGARVKVTKVGNGWARVKGTLTNGEKGYYWIIADQIYEYED